VDKRNLLQNIWKWIKIWGCCLA